MDLLPTRRFASRHLRLRMGNSACNGRLGSNKDDRRGWFVCPGKLGFSSTARTDLPGSFPVIGNSNSGLDRSQWPAARRGTVGRTSTLGLCSFLAPADAVLVYTL